MRFGKAGLKRVPMVELHAKRFNLGLAARASVSPARQRPRNGARKILGRSEFNGC